MLGIVEQSAKAATAEAKRMSSEAVPPDRSRTGCSSSRLVEPCGSLYRSRTVISSPLRRAPGRSDTSW